MFYLDFTKNVGTPHNIFFQAPSKKIFKKNNLNKKFLNTFYDPPPPPLIFFPAPSKNKKKYIGKNVMAMVILSAL